MANNNGHSCTWSFGREPERRPYTLAACPQNQDKCGDLVVGDIEIAEAGETKTAKLMNMAVGDTCSFRMVVKCGAPVFDINEYKPAASGVDFKVTYLEFDGNKADKVGKSKSKGQPSFGDKWPAKDAEFKFAGKAEKGKQKLPRKKGKKGGQDVTSGLDATAADTAAEGEATAGFGTPTWGFYNPAEGGFKSYGTNGQGKQKDGIRTKNDTKCRDRMMLITITAVKKEGTRRILAETQDMILNLGSAHFMNYGMILSATAALGTMTIAASLY